MHAPREASAANRFAISTSPGTEFAAITNERAGGSVLVLKVSAASAEQAWRNAARDAAAAYGLGRARAGKIAKRSALCARGSGRDDSGAFTSDAVVLYKGGDAFVVLGRTTDNVPELRAIVGSLRLR